MLIYSWVVICTTHSKLTKCNSLHNVWWQRADGILIFDDTISSMPNLFVSDGMQNDERKYRETWVSISWNVGESNKIFNTINDNEIPSYFALEMGCIFVGNIRYRACFRRISFNKTHRNRSNGLSISMPRPTAHVTRDK